MSAATVSSLGEDDLIRRLSRALGRQAPRAPAGIGDDAAVVSPPRHGRLLWSMDQLAEGVHFRRATTPAALLGRKALAVNLSDVAAMGGAARSFLLGLALPPSLSIQWYREFVRGLAAAARAGRVCCVGGDTTASRSGIWISVAVMGEVAASAILTRSAARPGDGLWVSGPLGAAALGLRLLRRGWRLPGGRVQRGRGRETDRAAARALRAHLDPRPPLDLGPWLARNRVARAAIDLSDGLSTDLPRLCRESGVGARIQVRDVPVDPAVRGARDAVRLALHGGEDYALLFAVPPRRERRLEALPRRRRVGPVRIGTIMPASHGVRAVGLDGRIRPLEAGGFRHFSGAAR